MDENNRFDVAVIGAGSGGYIAAIRAAQLGFKVACCDDWTGSDGKPAPGGTCTNVGCIPSKALLQSTEYLELAGHGFAEHGVKVGDLTFDVAQTMRRKAGAVRKNNEGILYLFRKNKISFFHGHAAFTRHDGEQFELVLSGSNTTLSAKHVIIATGSVPRPLLDLPYDESQILSNDGALRLEEAPRRLGVIGAGVIGVELGSVWRRVGSEVTLLEAAPSLLPMLDADLAKEALKAFVKQGLKFEFSVRVTSVRRDASGVQVSYETAEGGSKLAEFDKLIVCVGRQANTAGLDGAAIGLELDARGYVAVDASCQTNVKNVWAIGDVVRGPMLAHKAEAEGVAVAERIAGQLPEVDFNTIPSVIYTHPEIAWVGKTEQELKAAGVDYRAGNFPFMASGRARALGDTTGFAKVLVDSRSDAILGVHVIGPQASELIVEGTMAMEFRATAEDIAAVSHAHPTLGEVLKEASLASGGRALNF
jgi:dihydrolipoamide dehydrogenase